MDLQRETFSRRLIDQVLGLDVDPITKVQQLVDMGLDEEASARIVERYQIGQQSVVYYEQLPLGIRPQDL